MGSGTDRAPSASGASPASAGRVYTIARQPAPTICPQGAYIAARPTRPLASKVQTKPPGRPEAAVIERRALQQKRKRKHKTRVRSEQPLSRNATRHDRRSRAVLATPRCSPALSRYRGRRGRGVGELASNAPNCQPSRGFNGAQRLERVNSLHPTKAKSDPGGGVSTEKVHASPVAITNGPSN